MEILSSCVLIGFDPDAHEAGSAVTETRNTVNVTEKDVGLTEYYQATGQGLRPEKRLLIPYERDYHGERELEYEGRRWRVIRKTGGEYNGVLLTIQPWDGIASSITVQDQNQTGGGSGGDNPGSGTGGNDEQSEPVDIDYEEVTTEPAANEGTGGN